MGDSVVDNSGELSVAVLTGPDESACDAVSAGVKNGSTPAMACRQGRSACVMGESGTQPPLIAKSSLRLGSLVSEGNTVGGNGTNRLAQSVESMKGLLFSEVLCMLVAQPLGAKCVEVKYDRFLTETCWKIIGCQQQPHEDE